MCIEYKLERIDTYIAQLLHISLHIPKQEEFSNKLLEAVQRRGARFAMNCYDRYQSVTKMLCNLEWPTLEQR